MKDYYKTLEINKNASQEEIKKAYNKLAKQYHPDVCKEENAEQKMKEINEAYEALTKPNHGQPDMFDDIFKGFGFSFDGRRSGFSSFFSQQNFELEVDFLTLILGGEITVNQQKVTIPKLSRNGQHIVVSKTQNSQLNAILKAKMPSKLTEEEENILKEYQRIRK
jgi:DnaJ-class molecular chaperone